MLKRVLFFIILIIFGIMPETSL